MELRNASDKSKGSPSSSEREAFSLSHADALRYESVPAELLTTETKSKTVTSEAASFRPHLIKRTRSFHTVRSSAVLSET
jgi:hypothetical protein